MVGSATSKRMCANIAVLDVDAVFCLCDDSLITDGLIYNFKGNAFNISASLLALCTRLHAEF